MLTGIVIDALDDAVMESFWLEATRGRTGGFQLRFVGTQEPKTGKNPFRVWHYTPHRRHPSERGTPTSFVRNRSTCSSRVARVGRVVVVGWSYPHVRRRTRRPRTERARQGGSGEVGRGRCTARESIVRVTWRVLKAAWRPGQKRLKSPAPRSRASWAPRTEERDGGEQAGPEG